MLLKKQSFENGTTVGIWRIEESADYFLNQIQHTAEDLTKIAAMHERRKTEWLAARHLLRELVGAKVSCSSDAFGKPILVGSSQFLSISHSEGLVCVVVSAHEIGVDIQKIVPKISRVAPRFMDDAATKRLDAAHSLAHLHIYWGAKEALYKAYGKKNLNFRGHIFVHPFDYLPKGSSTGTVEKDDFKADFNIFFETIATDYILVVAEKIAG